MSIILKVCFGGHCVPSWYQGKHPVQSLRTLYGLGRIKGLSFSSMKYVICLKSLASFWWSCFSEPSVVLCSWERVSGVSVCVQTGHLTTGGDCHQVKGDSINSFLPACLLTGLMLHILCVLSFLSLLLFLSDSSPMRKVFLSLLSCREIVLEVKQPA